MANALNEILAGKISGGEIETVVHIEEDETGAVSSVAFPCHLCKEVFNRKKALQKHIHNHQDFRPSVVSEFQIFVIILDKMSQMSALYYYFFLNDRLRCCIRFEELVLRF